MLSPQYSGLVVVLHYRVDDLIRHAEDIKGWFSFNNVILGTLLRVIIYTRIA